MTREEAARWWEGLSEEEKEKARERMKRFREMSPEARKELERRTQLLRTVGEEVIAGMNPEQRKNFDKLPPPERERVHRELVRKALKERGEDVDGWGEMPPPRGGFEDRLRWSREQREEWRKKRRERELERAIEDGWLSKKAVARLREQPPEKIDAELDQVRQWRTIEWLDENDGWAKMEVDEKKRAELVALPPQEFFEQLRECSGPLRERGRRGGSRGSRGNGEGPPPRPGEGPPPGDGPPRDGRPGGEGPPRGEGPPPPAREGGGRQGGGRGGWRF